MKHLATIAPWDRFTQAERFGLVVRTSVGAKKDVHQWRDVSIVARIPVTVMVPVMKFWCPDEHAEGADGEANVRVDVDRPDAAESYQAREGMEGEPEDESWQVDQRHGVDRINRMFSMSGQPVEVLGAVVNAVEVPEKAESVLQAMSPVDEQVAQEDDFESLERPRLSSDGSAEGRRYESVRPHLSVG